MELVPNVTSSSPLSPAQGDAAGPRLQDTVTGRSPLPPGAEPGALLQHNKRVRNIKKQNLSKQSEARSPRTPSLKDARCVHAEAPRLTLLHWLSERTGSPTATGVLNPQRCWGHHGPVGGLAPMAEPSSPSPSGAEQPCFSLGSWHATRASPLPIRPPTHAHPSPIQTLSAINKQWKCQPAPGKSPRQLHPI